MNHEIVDEVREHRDESMGIDPNDEEQVRVWERQQQGWRRRGNTDPEDDNG